MIGVQRTDGSGETREGAGWKDRPKKINWR